MLREHRRTMREMLKMHTHARTANIQPHIKTRDEIHHRLADEKPRGTKKRRLLLEKRKDGEEAVKNKRSRPQFEGLTHARARSGPPGERVKARTPSEQI